MSIKDFEVLIANTKQEIQAGHVNMVLENMIMFAEEARKANKSGFEMMKNFIRTEKV